MQIVNNYLQVRIVFMYLNCEISLSSDIKVVKTVLCNETVLNFIYPITFFRNENKTNITILNSNYS